MTNHSQAVNCNDNSDPDRLRDPAVHCEIVHRLAGYEFPWDMARSLELAMLKTFCIPAISKLLDATGEFRHRPQKRYDDTGLLLDEITKWGYNSDRGRRAIARMNAIHGRFKISNDDFLYVLSTFIYEPIRWFDRFGWRSLNRSEQLAIFYFWQNVGNLMSIRHIPKSYEAFEQYNLNYEHQHFRYTKANERTATATLTSFLADFPAFLRPALQIGFSAICDENMRKLLGFNSPSALVEQLVESGLKGRSRLAHFFPPRSQSYFYVDLPNRTYPGYPQGYEIEDLGAQKPEQSS